MIITVVAYMIIIGLMSGLAGFFIGLEYADNKSIKIKRRTTENE